VVPSQYYARETDVLMFHLCLEESIFTNILEYFPARDLTSHRGTTFWKITVAVYINPKEEAIHVNHICNIQCVGHK